MKGLDWTNESYVRLNKSDTPAWKRLRWEAQAVYVLILRKLDRAGRLNLDGLLPFEAVAEMTGAPDDVAERALAKILEGGFLIVSKSEDVLIDPEYLDREEAKMSDAQRKRESRARRRELALSQNVTDASQNVPEASHAVTDGHTQSHAVTPSVPSLPTIEEPPQSPPEGGETSKCKRAKDPTDGIDIPAALAAIGIKRGAPDDPPEAPTLRNRIQNCKTRKKAATWQAELNRLAPLVAEVGRAAVLETWAAAVSTGWQGCTPEFVRDRAAKARGQRQPTTAQPYYRDFTPGAARSDTP